MTSSPFKITFDIVASFVGLIVLSPVLAVLAIAIKLDSRGPIFYRGERVGFRGKRFRIFKFRTMVVGADRIGGPSTAAGDPRVTRVGRFLRSVKLDEFPQLINVLKREMSIVGPRPEVPYYVAMFTEEEKAILEVRPGITDWASIWNSDEAALLAGSPDPEKKYIEEVRPHKIRLQLEYVRNHSFATDLRILWETCKVLVPGHKSIAQASARLQGGAE